MFTLLVVAADLSHVLISSALLATPQPHNFCCNPHQFRFINQCYYRWSPLHGLHESMNLAWSLLRTTFMAKEKTLLLWWWWHCTSSCNQLRDKYSSSPKSNCMEAFTRYMSSQSLYKAVQPHLDPEASCWVNARSFSPPSFFNALCRYWYTIQVIINCYSRELLGWFWELLMFSYSSKIPWKMHSCMMSNEMQVRHDQSAVET
jgi:hypothetical protein